MSDRASNQLASAVDAFCSAIRVEPSLVRESRAFGGMCVCSWKTPWIEGFELPATDELIVAHHRGGSYEVRAQSGGLLSRSRSVPGLLTIIPPGRGVAYRTGGPVTFNTLHVSRSALNDIFKSEAAGRIQERFAFRDQFVGSCIDSLLREARVRDRWSPRFVSAVTEALLLHLLRSSPAQPQEPLESSVQHRIHKARALIESEPAGELSLAVLAAEAGMSRAHFARTFNEMVGEPPHRYIMRQRIECAQRLLEESGLALGEVAYETGFCSQSHFTRAFRKQVGVPPQQYRAATRPRPSPAQDAIVKTVSNSYDLKTFSRRSRS
jgi:AraC family transcriptional regulator